MADWVKSNDADLQAQAVQFSTYLTANAVALGLVALDATTLAGFVTTFTTKLALVAAEATKTKVAVADKDTAKAVLVADLRSLGRRIQANPVVTDTQKTALGLPIHDTGHSPVPVPVTRPVVSIIGVAQTDVAVRAVDETTPLSRSKPAGAVGPPILLVGEQFARAGGPGAIPVRRHRHQERLCDQLQPGGRREADHHRGSLDDAQGRSGPDVAAGDDGAGDPAGGVRSGLSDQD